MEELVAQMKYKFCIIFIIILLFCGCTNSSINEYRNKGIVELNNGNYESALDYFNTAISLGKGNVGKLQYDLIMYKAETLFLLKKYDEAKNIYESLIQIDRRNKTFNELYNNINSIIYKIDFKKAIDNNDIDAAETILENLKKIGTEHEKCIMYNQAVLYEKKGQWKDALNSFIYYLKMYPDDTNAQYEVDFINNILIGN